MGREGTGRLEVGAECLLINKSIVWRPIHSLLRGHGGLVITEPCLCQEGRGVARGRWQGAGKPRAILTPPRAGVLCLLCGRRPREGLARNSLRPASAPWMA